MLSCYACAAQYSCFSVERKDGISISIGSIPTLGPWAMHALLHQEISSKSVHNFFSYPTDKQTDRQTDRSKNIISFFGGGNYRTVVTASHKQPIVCKGVYPLSARSCTLPLHPHFPPCYQLFFQSAASPSPSLIFPSTLLPRSKRLP